MIIIVTAVILFWARCYAESALVLLSNFKKETRQGVTYCFHLTAVDTEDCNSEFG